MRTIDVAIYCRLSRNRHGESDNTAIQQAECEAYAADQGWTVTLIKLDDDLSASKYSTKPRPGYENLVNAIQAGQVQIVLCTEMPRLYRKVEDLLELIQLAATTRLERIETTDGMSYNLATPEGVYQSIGAVNSAVFESGRLSTRVKRKKAARARQGAPSGGHRSFGYTDNGLELIPKEAAILREAKDRYLAGATMKEIVRDFNSRSIVTSEGKPLTIENFQRTLFNRRHVGIRVHNGDEYPAIWPPIFTAEEYETMDSRRRARAQQWPGRGRGVGRQYLLTGVVYCGLCGAYMIGKRRKVNSGYQRRYVCRKLDNYGQQVGCGKIYRSSDPLDEWITEAVLYRLDTPEVAHLLANDEDENINALVTEYQAAKARLETMTRDYASGFLSREQYGIAKTTAERNLEVARIALTKVQSRPAQLPATGELIRQAWASSSLEWRNSVIKLVVTKVVCLPGHPGSHEWRGYRFQSDHVRIEWRA